MRSKDFKDFYISCAGRFGSNFNFFKHTTQTYTFCVCVVYEVVMESVVSSASLLFHMCVLI